MHTVVEVDTRRIEDWHSFHDVFAEAFGFPDWYGRNLNAWIDCMTSLGEPDDGLTTIHAPGGSALVLSLSDADDLAARCPDIFAAVVECSAFVNHRLLAAGEQPVLMLSFCKQAPE